MMGRVVVAIVVAVGATLGASAQSDDTPTLPGGPSGGSPKCRALLNTRDELQKHGQAIEAANKKRADVKLACRLFRTYIATEAKMLRMLEADGASCGAQLPILQQVRDNHAKSQQVGKQVCDAAARQPFRYDAPVPPIDEDTIWPFRLHPEPRPKPWFGLSATDKRP